VISFFVFYAFLIGGVSLLLFRLSRQRMGMYALIVVVSASVLAGLLGGYLRLSRGDLYWTSVTQGTVGGFVQTARLDARSAGGRSTRVAVDGEHVDLQHLTGISRYNYGWQQQVRIGFPPFTWRQNGSSDVDEYQLDVPITPWGRREFQATAYRRGAQPLDFDITYEPAAPADRANNPMAGRFLVKLANHAPFNLQKCVLLIGVTRTEAEFPRPDLNQYGPGYATYRLLMPAATSTGIVDVYQQHRLDRLAAGETTEFELLPVFQSMRNPWEQTLALDFPGGQLSAPRIALDGSASAWIIAQIDESPIMQINREQSDFDPLEPVHLYVQEIRPEDLHGVVEGLSIAQPAAP
jgi:hypothetical protein